MLFEALTTRKTVTVGERLIVPYKLAEVRIKYLFTAVLICTAKCMSKTLSTYLYFKPVHYLGDIYNISTWVFFSINK